MLTETAQRQFGDVWREVMVHSGLLTDELTSRKRGAYDPFDLRDFSDASTALLYIQLHKMRGQARFARDVLTAYASELSPTRALLLAFEAYAEIWLADMYCSGVPLSVIDFEGDYTNLPPSTTDQIYAHAVTLFDSALALSSDSSDVQTLARIGKGRALLAQGRYDDAETAVTDLQAPDSYEHTISFRSSSGSGSVLLWKDATVSDNEGLNGLSFQSSGDPRTLVISVAITGSNAGTAFLPAKYGFNETAVVKVASGIEAFLIKAEAAMQRGDITSWLSSLNTLRTTGAYTRIDTIYQDGMLRTIDTLWEAGTGRVPGLRPLTQPENEGDRLMIHFAERAAWLFATGQRQADLRRLVRKYGLHKDDVYPTGVYLGPEALGAFYGNDIDLPIPDQERQNKLFTGCLTRD